MEVNNKHWNIPIRLGSIPRIRARKNYVITKSGQDQDPCWDDLDDTNEPLAIEQRDFEDAATLQRNAQKKALTIKQKEIQMMSQQIVFTYRRRLPKDINKDNSPSMLTQKNDLSIH